MRPALANTGLLAKLALRKEIGVWLSLCHPMDLQGSRALLSRLLERDRFHAVNVILERKRHSIQTKALFHLESTENLLVVEVDGSKLEAVKQPLGSILEASDFVGATEFHFATTVDSFSATDDVVDIQSNNTIHDHVLAVLLKDEVGVVLRKGCSCAQVHAPIKNMTKKAELISANTVCSGLPLLRRTNVTESRLEGAVWWSLRSMSGPASCACRGLAQQTNGCPCPEYRPEGKRL